ncbi:thioredoxin domain-containing protein [Novosphingobium lentum]|uniref:thioredoxin domain-containing protein n=1 Tax=Novosphingobium lentum TaxID=145287 RepID=UPI0008335B85|nr:thioredoxin domain-containing protein [Novosphingobium lentum]
MTIARLFRPLALVVALPLALGLAACGKKDDASAPASTATAAPIAKIAAPAGKAWSDMIAKTPEGGYLMGNPDAPIKLVEFGALSCSHCAEFAEKSYAKLRDDYVASGRVSYELRLFMLNALDVPAAMLATCGAPETVIPLSEQFWAWQPNMFDNLKKNQAVMDQVATLPDKTRFSAIAQAGGMTEFFASRGIAKDQAETCLADSAKATMFADATTKAVDKYDVKGTPTFYLNGSKATAGTWEEINAELQRMGAR